VNEALSCQSPIKRCLCVRHRDRLTDCDRPTDRLTYIVIAYSPSRPRDKDLRHRSPTALSAYLKKQIPDSFHKPLSSWFTSSYTHHIITPLSSPSSSIASSGSVFDSRLQTNLFHKYFPPCYVVCWLSAGNAFHRTGLGPDLTAHQLFWLVFDYIFIFCYV